MTPIYNHSREPDGADRDTPKPQKLTLGSLFDGSGGFPLGGLLSGITPVWASEIEPFPIRVTTKRLPFMKHYGDVSRMDGGKIEPVDIITFGSPCQDMSIAGRREGLDGSRSSQFASGLLIALAHAITPDGTPAPAALTVTGPIVSRPYLDMTLRLMERFGISFTEREEGVFGLSPACAPAPESIAVSGDWSQAAVLLCVDAMGGGVMLPNLRRDGLQGDARIVDVLEEMGLRIRQTRGEWYAASPSHAGLMPARIDCSDIPDLAPILALTCTQARGVSTLTGVSRLRLKECDRLLATQELLGRLGAKTDVSPDGDTLTVTGPVRLRGGFTADARGDHRMVMLLATAALIADGPITVTGAECISKSWPGFVETYRQLGGIAR